VGGSEVKTLNNQSKEEVLGWRRIPEVKAKAVSEFVEKLTKKIAWRRSGGPKGGEALESGNWGNGIVVG